MTYHCSKVKHIFVDGNINLNLDRLRNTLVFTAPKYTLSFSFSLLEDVTMRHILHFDAHCCEATHTWKIIDKHS